MTDPNGAAIYGVPWIPSIYPSHVSINIPAPWIRHEIGIVSQSIVVICHYNLNVGYYQHLPTIMGYCPSITKYIFWLVVWHMFFYFCSIYWE